MASFKDNAGVEWNVVIDYTTGKRIREDCDPQFMIGDDTENNTPVRLERDPILLCRVLYLTCEKDRLQRDVSEEYFYMNVIGPVIRNAKEALLESILFFTPPETKQLIEAAAAVRDQVREAGMEKVMARINSPQLAAALLENLDRSLDEVVNRLLTRSASAGSSPEQSASPLTA